MKQGAAFEGLRGLTWWQQKSARTDCPARPTAPRTCGQACRVQLRVLSRTTTTNDAPALLMYFIDSGGGSYPQVISSAQVDWFQSQAQFLNPNGRLANQLVRSSYLVLYCYTVHLFVFDWSLQDPRAGLLACTEHVIRQGSPEGEIWNRETMRWLHQQGRSRTCREAVS
jgi:hypothetical protein